MHMIMTGPPGTGKTQVSKLVGVLLFKLGIVKSKNFVYVSNALDLLSMWVGETAQKVQKKVDEAEGGVLLIDEAYSIVGDSHGKQAIDKIMACMMPPQCLFIFAGYPAEMNKFLDSNPGLRRRAPYRFNFPAYSVSVCACCSCIVSQRHDMQDLVLILEKMVVHKHGELLDPLSIGAFVVVACHVSIVYAGAAFDAFGERAKSMGKHPGPASSTSAEHKDTAEKDVVLGTTEDHWTDLQKQRAVIQLLLLRVPETQRREQNAGLIERWLDFARQHRVRLGRLMC